MAALSQSQDTVVVLSWSQESSDSGCTIIESIDSGCTVTESRDSGCTVIEPRDSGCTVIEPRDSGFYCHRVKSQVTVVVLS